MFIITLVIETYLYILLLFNSNNLYIDQTYIVVYLYIGLIIYKQAQ